MRAGVLRRLVGSVAVSSMLAGCSHQYVNPPVAEGPLPPPPVYRKNPILKFCEDYEWACILGGIAAFAGTALLIKNSGS